MRASRRLERRGARVVLGREDQHPLAGVGDDVVGEGVALLATAVEPHLDAVAGVRAGDLAGHHVVVVGVAGVVTLTPVPLARARASHPASVDPVLDRDPADVAAGEHADLLRIAVGDAELEVEQRRLAVLRVDVVRVQVERLHVDADRRLRVLRITRRPRQAHVEGKQPLELRLNQRLVVREHESRSRLAFAELGRIGDRADARLRVVGRLAVRHVQRVGGLPRIEARDGGVPVGAAERHVQRVVRVEGPDLPALRIEEPLAERVDVRVELRPDSVDESRQRPRLGLRGGGGTAIGLVRRIRGRPLVVVAPVLGVVAVGVHAVGGGYLAVAIVVAQVLAPQALMVVGVLVAVGVRRDDEPELRALEQPPDLPIIGAPAVDEVVQQATVHLDRDPLARVLVGRVQHRRPRPVALPAGTLRDLQRDYLATLIRPSDYVEVDYLGVFASHPVQLVSDSPRLVPGPVDVEAADRLRGGLRAHRPASPVALQPHLDAGSSQLGALGIGENDVGSNAPPRVAQAGELEALCRSSDLARVARDRVHLELLTPLAGGRRRDRQSDRRRSQCG